MPHFGSFSAASIAANLIFGSIGFVAFVYGKRNALFKPMIIGIVLIGYSYFVSGTLLTYLIGIALTVSLFIWRE